MRTTTHKEFVKFHESIAKAHLQIKGFYRFNWNEIAGKFRSGVETPALLLESYSSELEMSNPQRTPFNGKSVSFLLLDFTGKADNYEKQEQVLNDLENIALDICSYLEKENKNRDSWFFGLFELNSFRYEKVGPIFDNMYGWNVLYTIKNKESMIYDPAKWNWEHEEGETEDSE